MRAIPQKAIDIVKEFEGLRLIGYLCPANVPTAGWGHTSPSVKVGETYSKEQAQLWLMEDLRQAQRKLGRVVSEAVLDALNDNQYAALLSFVFNLGAAPGWTIWKRLKEQKLDLVPVEMMRFVNGGGKRLPGLVRRRTAEVALWDTPIHEHDEEEVPASAQLRLVGMTPPTPAPAPKTPIITSAIAAAAAIPAAATQVKEAVEPYASASPVASQIVAAVATIAAIAAMVLVALHWIEGHRAKK